MERKYTEIISKNPHFYALIIQVFLTGYKEKCSLEILYNVLPFITYLELREPLINANSRSSLYSVYSNSKNNLKEIQISNNVRKLGFKERYEKLKPFLGKALIILYSNKKIILIKDKVKLLEEKRYENFDKELREWLKSSYYLGNILKKITIKELKSFLEENTK